MNVRKNYLRYICKSKTTSYMTGYKRFCISLQDYAKDVGSITIQGTKKRLLYMLISKININKARDIE